MSITRGILRWGVISGLALGGAALFMGGENLAMGFAHVRAKAQGVMNNLIDDPVALRRQLEQLAEEYPDRIERVNMELAQVEHQLTEFKHDAELARIVVRDTTNDLQDLKTLVARAEAEKDAKARPVVLRFQGVRFDIDEAYNEGRRINSVRNAYQDRLAQDEFQVKLLEEQAGRLKEIQNKLADEYASYQGQLWQLDRQIDSIQRNERLITLLEENQATLQSYEKFGKVHNLKQVEGKLAELRAKQQAQLKQLQNRGQHQDYEGRAQYELDTRSLQDTPFGDLPSLEDASNESDADDDEDDATAKSGPSIAWNGPIVIE